MIELARVAKAGGGLTKTIGLDATGAAFSDSSSCFMTSGDAQRWRPCDVREVAGEISAFKPNQALTLGALKPTLPDQVRITTLRKLNGATDLIARTLEYFEFRPGPALALLDHDIKGMPAEVSAKIVAAGGFWPALCGVIPALGRIARVVRASTSTGIYRGDTGEKIPGSGGWHVFLLVSDGCDIPRFLTDLHRRCWRAGLGWYTLGTAGQLLERSIVDRSVGSPERLVFEGPPILVAPLCQDAVVRRPVATEGDALDTRQACPPLSAAEDHQLSAVLARECLRLQPESDRVRRDYITTTARHLGVDASVIDKRCQGILRPECALDFDDSELKGSTVASVLAKPERYVGETLADPIEGVTYGRGKAKVLRRDDSLIVHSFAHGLNTAYLLRHDRQSIEAAMRASAREKAAQVLVDGIVNGDVDPAETEELLDLGVKVTGVKRRPLNDLLKRGRMAAAAVRAKQTRTRKLSELRDHRPQLPAPVYDGEWLPVVERITDVLLASTAREPPCRDPDGYLVRVWARPLARLHTLVSEGDNPLPPPDQVLITRLSQPLAAELIEENVAFLADDKFGLRLVHLDPRFVNHMMHRPNDQLPVLTAVSTLPVVLDDGTILAENGLHHQHRTVFRIPAALPPLLPDRTQCTWKEITTATKLLVDDWLVDVRASREDKCVLIALALSIVERVLLAERPAFFVTSAVRGGGKTTVLNMISLAVLGQRASAAAWSPNEEERRKALFSYLMEGVPLLVWDNLHRGAKVSCPHIEKALTAETFSDRILGVSGTAAPFAATIQVFNGNRIAPRGDLVSRSMTVELPIGRLDPENRHFTHPDPFDWTMRNRDRLLVALYTLLMGNPRREMDPEDRDPAPTRFKAWWNLVGSAVEHAASVTWGADMSFKNIFTRAEGGDEQAIGIDMAVRLLHDVSGGARFQASDACLLVEHGRLSDTGQDDDRRARNFRMALEQVNPRPLGKEPSTISVSRRLQGICGVPIAFGNNRVVTLHYVADHHGGWFNTDEG